MYKIILVISQFRYKGSISLTSSNIFQLLLSFLDATLVAWLFNTIYWLMLTDVGLGLTLFKILDRPTLYDFNQLARILDQQCSAV